MNVLLEYLNPVTVLLEYIDSIVCEIFSKYYHNARIMIFSIMLKNYYRSPSKKPVISTFKNILVESLPSMRYSLKLG